MHVRPVLFVTIAATLLLGPAAAAGASTTDAAQISGVAWLDLDGDGQRDDGEPGLARVQVTLRTSASILDATTTDADGRWSFNNVEPATYDVRVEPPIDYKVTGGTLPGLSTDTGQGTITVTANDLDVGAVGLGSPVASGPDIATTVTRETTESSDGGYRWTATVFNFGPDDATGPVDVRIVLSEGHETRDIASGDWSCERSAAIVLCELDSTVPAGTALPPVTVTTGPTGDVGATVSVTATARLDGIFDAAPLNDEDEATAFISGEIAAADLDGDGTGDLTNAGAATSGLLVAAIIAFAIGASAVRTSRRAANLP